MSSQAGSPTGEASTSQLQPANPRKRGRKEGGGTGGSRGKGKGRARDDQQGEGSGQSQQQQQQSSGPSNGQSPAQVSQPMSQSAIRAEVPAPYSSLSEPRPGRRTAAADKAAAGETGHTGAGRRSGQRLSRKNLFAKDLPMMMYAFGDDIDPLPESANVLEEILVDYLSEMCKSAAAHAPNAKKIRMEDLRFALRRPQQGKQLARVEELLYLQEDIARARRNLGDIQYGKNAAPAF